MRRTCVAGAKAEAPQVQVVLSRRQPSRLCEPCGFAPHLRKWFALCAFTSMLPPQPIPRHLHRAADCCPPEPTLPVPAPAGL